MLDELAELPLKVIARDFVVETVDLRPQAKPTEIRIRLRRSGPSEPSGGDGRCAEAPRKRRIKELGSRDEPTFASSDVAMHTRGH